MSDNVTATLDASGVLDALHRFPETVLRYTKPACKVSADSIQREAQRRVRRKTGETADGIVVRESRNGDGYVVTTTDVRADAGQVTRSNRYSDNGGKARIAPGHYQVKHVALWLEAGTKHMDAKPFFYPAVRLEESAHERRIGEAVARAIASEGLGG